MLSIIKKFKVTKTHLKLLKRMITSWYDAEFGAPCIDPKRPYGNSDVIRDMGDILGIKPEGDKNGYDDERDFSKEQEEYLNKFHQEMETVLQILLVNGQLKTGEYECQEYSRNWKKNEKR